MSSANFESATNIGEWRREKVLGTGGFGTVGLWKNNITNEQVAVKRVRAGHGGLMTPKHQERWRLEVDIMHRLDHPNVVKAIVMPADLLLEVEELPPLAMEYCTGGDLRKVLNRPENCNGLSEREIRIIASNISSALEYLHSMRIIHRDLKPENIVLQEIDGKMVYKLIDLGYAKDLDQGSLCTSFVGTLQYLAPELFLSEKYTGSVDYWSLGILIHECIKGTRPFFPKYSPAQWIPLVMKKSSEHIGAHSGSDGRVVFISDLGTKHRISKLFQTDMEKWLRVMLEWNPDTRGSIVEDSKKTVIAFTILKDILSKKIVKVFLSHSYKLIYYEIKDETSLSELLKWISIDANLPEEKLLFLLPKGNTPEPKRTAIQCCSESDSEDTILFVFPKISKEFIMNSDIPKSLEHVMNDGSQSPTIQEVQLKLWTDLVSFIQNEFYMATRLLRSLKVLMLHLLSHNSVMFKTTTKITKDLTYLKAKANVFNESLLQDMENYQVQARQGGITSEKMFQTWSTHKELLDKVTSLEEKVVKVHTKFEAINTRAIGLQQSPYSKSKVPVQLNDLFQKTLSAFTTFKKLKSADKLQQLDGSEVVKLLTSFLKHKERCHQDLSSHIQKLMQCKNDIHQLVEPLRAVLMEISTLNLDLDTARRERQLDIWKIVETLCKKISSMKSEASNLNNSQNFVSSYSCSSSSSRLTLSNSYSSSRISSSTGEMQPVSLSDVLAQSKIGTSAIIQENSFLITRLKDVVIDLAFMEDST